MHATSSKGNICVARATADLITKGYDVLLPVCSTSPFDLAIYADERFRRVQVKYITASDGIMFVDSVRKSIWQGKVRKERNTEIDIICAFSPDTDKCYYVLAADAPITLRFTAPKNGQRSGVSWAFDYLELPLDPIAALAAE